MYSSAYSGNIELVRYMLEAAGTSVDRVDALLKEERDKLDAGFLAHLQSAIASSGVLQCVYCALRLRKKKHNDPCVQVVDSRRWEVDQQVKKQNRKLLGILEVVVQRTCLEMEGNQPEVAERFFQGAFGSVNGV